MYKLMRTYTTSDGTKINQVWFLNRRDTDYRDTHCLTKERLTMAIDNYRELRNVNTIALRVFGSVVAEVYGCKELLRIVEEDI